ncbi:MAG: hypothetical protein ACYDCL_15095 [Myxococcales bacterium]
MRKLVFGIVAIIGGSSVWAGSAQAIPAFARKYQTSCTTCHTAWPSLNPFGEAFRRNGFRFPGDDKDAIKQEMVKMGVGAYKKVFPDAVWPDVIPDSVPLAFGFIGNAAVAPVAGSSATKPSTGLQNGPNGASLTTPYFDMSNLVAEAHFWSGGTFNDSLSFFGEVTLTTGSSPVDIERGYLIFDDLLSGVVGQHVFNLLVGKNFPTLTSFDNHSSYVADGYLPEITVPTMTGAAGTTTPINGSFTPGINELGTIELNGVVAGRFDYSVGVNSGTNDYVGPNNSTVLPSAADVYGHVGVKIGGMRLDGEGGEQVSSKPWAESSLTADVFAYHSESTYNDDNGNRILDTALTLGGALRGQIGSFGLTLGALDQLHNHPDASGTAVSALTGWGEASYVVWPWFIPALRVEYTRIDGTQDPNFAFWSTPVLVRYLPALNFVVRPNVVVQLVAEIDRGNGAPPGGWSGAGGIIGFPLQASTATSATEFETITANLRYAF